MNNKDVQHVYFYIDDSGKISKKEDYAIFAGIVFKNKKEKNEFTNKYRSIINDMKCSYCAEWKVLCERSCPEIKGNIIRNQDRRRIMNINKKYITFGTVIYNTNLKQEIVNRAPSKGRFVEYAQRRLIKKTVINLKNKGHIDINKPLFLHINIDEMPTKSNGYYALQEGLYEELKHGIRNWNYGKTFPPVVYSDLKIEVIYKDSKYDYGIQMADIIAGTMRRTFVFNNNWFTSREYIMNKLQIDVLLRLPN